MQIYLKMLLLRVVVAVFIFYSVNCDDDDERAVSFPRPPRCRPRCPRGQKCVQTSSGCQDSRNCPTFPSCVSRRTQTCRPSSCPKDTFCVNEVAPCLVPPCPVFLRCLPRTSSSRPTCNSGNDCPPGGICIQVVEKGCNSLSCPSRLVCSSRDESTCATAFCPPGSLGCINILPKRCPDCKIEFKCLQRQDTSRRKCKTNRDCPKDGICTRVVESDCTSLSCPSRLVCAPQDEITCRNVLCAPGNLGCINILPTSCPDCEIKATCISTQGTPCGSTNCKSDDQCVDLQNCGPHDRNCQSQFSCLPKTARTCESVVCEPGKKCVMLFPPCLPDRPCFPLPVCQDGPTIPPPPCGLNEECQVIGGGRGICTEVVGEDCNTPSCPRKAVCIPSSALSCRTARCVAGTVCVNVQLACSQPVCPLRPRCIPIQSEDCGGVTCSQGNQCVDVHTCETGDCTPFKRCIPNTITTCASKTCLLPSQCIMLQPFCVREPCYPAATCTPTTPRPVCRAGARCTVPGGKEGYCGEVADQSCNSFNCPKQLQCIPSRGPGCHAVRCANCVNIQLPCPRQPCPIEPKCFSPVSDCGGRQCAPGQRCEDVQRCSGRRCTIQKSCVDNRGPSCAAVTCERGNRCALVEVQCFRAPCYPQPSCIPINSNGGLKRGQCPRIRDQRLGRSCQSDSQCSGTEKCCELAGVRAKTCIQAVSGEPKPGRCPRPDPNVGGICVFNPEVNCIEDNECPRDLKCCSRGCGKECIGPIYGKK